MGFRCGCLKWIFRRTLLILREETMSAVTQTFKVTERIVNTKRHTIGYVINGSEIDRKEAVRLAELGWIRNARPAKGNGGTYLVGENNSLYNLPIRFR